MSSLTVKATLAYQFDSKYYSKLELNDLVTNAINLVDGEISEYSVVYDEIEAGQEEYIHDNITNIIKDSQIFIAEISDLNQNVLYELGLAKGLNKYCILIREENAKQELPFDIASFQYMTYKASNMKSFRSQLANKIKKAVECISPENLISQESWNTFLRKHIENIESSDQLDEVLTDVVNRAQKSFYYLGIAGFKSTNWIDRLSSKEEKVNIYRIAYFQTLKDIYIQYRDREILKDYALWLALCYSHLKKDCLKLYNSADIGTWVAGMSVIVSDTSDALIFTGTFNDHENRGIFLKDESNIRIFKEYCKSLTLSGYVQRLYYYDIGKYFSFSTGTEDVPAEIIQALELDDIKALIEACEKYVIEEVKKLSANII